MKAQQAADGLLNLNLICDSYNANQDIIFATNTIN